MLPPTISVHKAELELAEWQVSRELEEDKSFYLHAVSESWGEDSIIWNNQPSVAGEPIEVPKSSRRERKYINLRWHEIDIAGFVNKWITNPSTNHGVRISLKDTGDKDYIDFGSTEAKDRFLSNIAPEVKIIFGNPEWNPESRIIDAGFLSRGDTATISYENFGTNSVSMYTDNTRIIDTTKVTGNDLNFYNQHETDRCECYLTTERLDLFVFMEDSNADELLLGESKYYYAVEDPEEADQLLLMELPVADGKPQLDQLPGEALSNPFDDNPVEVVSGGKSGVYWEKKYPEISSDGTLIMHDLPSGIIRLAGRYWEAGKYKVKLKANHGGKTGELEITVVKPDRLGDQYGKARDVFDRMVDVDSLIIANAGKYGIPPQFIKAHISVEAAKKNFGGDVGWGFAPSYRYEPFTTQFLPGLKRESGKYYIK